MKVHHGKLLTASGTYTTIATSDGLVQLQEGETKKEKHNSGNKLVILSQNLHGNPDIGLSTNTSSHLDMHSGQTEHTKRGEEADFVVDYHYGDSMLNDDEVARISDAASCEVSPLLLNSKNDTINTNYEFPIKIPGAPGRDGQRKHRHDSTRSSESYYPSSNSEFSTPSHEDQYTWNMKKSPSSSKANNTPPLLKFGALPPEKISSAFTIDTLNGSLNIPNPDAVVIKDEKQKETRNISDTAIQLNNTNHTNSVFSSKSAFDRISNFRLTSTNENEAQLTQTRNIVIDDVAGNLGIKQIGITSTANMNSQRSVIQKIPPQGITIRSMGTTANKPSFTLSSTGSNQKSFVVQSAPSRTSITLPRQDPQQLIITDGAPPNNTRINAVSNGSILYSQDQPQKNNAAPQLPSASMCQVIPTFSTTGASQGSVSSNIALTSDHQRKQAILAQINGRQVLLIPKQEQAPHNAENTKPSAIFTSQNVPIVTSSLQSYPKYKIIRSTPASTITSASNALHPVKAEPNITTSDIEPSKLEQCLLYGSASVGKTVVRTSNVSVPYSYQGVNASNTNNHQSSSLMKFDRAAQNNYNQTISNVKHRESIESMRRDSTDSGKSDIITSSTIDASLVSQGQFGRHPISTSVSSGQSHSYQFLIPNNCEANYEKAISVFGSKSNEECMKISSNVVGGGSNSIRVVPYPPTSVPTTQDILIADQTDLYEQKMVQSYDEGKMNQVQDVSYTHHNHSVSSDSGFIEQSPDVTPQSVSFSYR